MPQRIALFIRKRSACLILGCCLLLAGAFPPHSDAADALLYDDFSSGSLDMSKWEVASWAQDTKTTFGDTPVMQTEDGTSFARFRVQTYYDASATRVLGTDIYSDSKFDRETGLVCEARLRVTSAATAGLVAAFFLYERYDGASDEIDYEFLTNQNTNRVLLSNWNNWIAAYGQNDGVHHTDSNPTVSGLHFATWTTVKILWLPSETRWIINGTEVWRTSQAVPDQAMKLHINFWAPDSTWSAANDPNLKPVGSAASNTSYYYDVDYIKVTRYSGSETPALPPLGWIGLGVLLGLLALATIGGMNARRV